jgi:hypothetical protein
MGSISFVSCGKIAPVLTGHAGQQYALTEAAYLIVKSLQQFDAVEWVGAQGQPKKGFGITMAPKDGVWVRFRKAKV